jgi:hypothetical protein
VTDPGRARNWSRLQAVAWLAFRSIDAARAAAQLESGTTSDSHAELLHLSTSERALRVLRRTYAALAAAVQIGDLRSPVGRAKPGVRVWKAIRVLDRLEKKGIIAADASGKYRASEVRALCSSIEGPGLAPAKRPISPASVHKLGWLFLTSQRGNGLGWCQDNGLVTTQRQYSALRKLALEWARLELSTRCRLNVSLRDAKNPLTENEKHQCEENLRSWQIGGRPQNKFERV